MTDTSTHRRTTPLTVYASSVFMVALAIAYVNGMVPRTLVSLYLVMSLLCYAAYALDKEAAQKGRWRIAENSLHLLALFGGWPGARLAQHRFRHKTQKAAFRRLFWVTVALNLAGLAWLMTPAGSAALRAFLTQLYQAVP
ncbi:DUF1294 domain-containing protein [Saccharospirillum impatiens]|uniref:DUF1294 domain-containing protein n=1 Tax=Saccharospirillum impatiens TaxID=169438 RepID=UPI0004212650|nr:DUF1294 domain-containing protein [Saccharospirillum impatiens]